jgi:hypothetical protein
MGSCSGGERFSPPNDSQTWKAVNCSSKKGDGLWGGRSARGGGVEIVDESRGGIKPLGEHVDTPTVDAVEFDGPLDSSSNAGS